PDVPQPLAIAAIIRSKNPVNPSPFTIIHSSIMKLINKRSLILITSVFLLLGGCKKAAPPLDVAAHRVEVQKWQITRDQNLRKDDSWLTLVGLYWLNEGENYVGSGVKNPVVLPKNKAPELAGSFYLEQGQVRLVARPKAGFQSGGQPVETLALKADTDDGGPTLLNLGSLLINVVKRGDRVGIRVKDSESL